MTGCGLRVAVSCQMVDGFGNINFRPSFATHIFAFIECIVLKRLLEQFYL
jgi:hypothetical protein